MWEKRLRSRSAFSKACSALTRGWGDSHAIQDCVQQQILEGFRKFYDKRHWKYPFVKTAKKVTFETSTKGGWTFVLHSASGKSMTVSKQCKPVNMKSDVREACRGAVHYDQILPSKRFYHTEVDHCNAGGFKSIFEQWIKDKNIEELYKSVVHNDPRVARSIKQGYKTFTEPTLTAWREFHRARAELQEVSSEAHKQTTKKRRLLS